MLRRKQKRLSPPNYILDLIAQTTKTRLREKHRRYIAELKKKKYFMLSVIADDIIFNFKYGDIAYEFVGAYLVEETEEKEYKKFIVTNYGLPRAADWTIKLNNYDLKLKSQYNKSQFEGKRKNFMQDEIFRLGGPVSFFYMLPDQIKVPYLRSFFSKYILSSSMFPVVESLSRFRKYLADFYKPPRINTYLNQLNSYRALYMAVDNYDFPTVKSEYEYTDMTLELLVKYPEEYFNGVVYDFVYNGKLVVYNETDNILFLKNISDILHPKNYIHIFPNKYATIMPDYAMFDYFKQYMLLNEYEEINYIRFGNFQHYKTIFNNAILENQLTTDWERISSRRDNYANKVKFDFGQRFRKCGMFSFYPMSDWNASVPDLHIMEVTIYIFLKIFLSRMYFFGLGIKQTKDISIFLKAKFTNDYVLKQNNTIEPPRYELKTLTKPRKDEEEVEQLLDIFRDETVEVGETVFTKTVGPIKPEISKEHTTEGGYIFSERAADLNYPTFIQEFLLNDEMGETLFGKHILSNKFMGKQKLKYLKNRTVYLWDVSKKLAIELIEKIYKTFFSEDGNPYGHFLYSYYWEKSNDKDKSSDAIKEVGKHKSVRWMATVVKVLTKFMITDIYVTKSVIGASNDPNKILQRAFQSFWLSDNTEYEKYIEYLQRLNLEVIPIRTQHKCLMRALIVLDLVYNKDKKITKTTKIGEMINRIRCGYEGKIKKDRTCTKCSLNAEKCQFHGKEIVQSELKDAIEHFFDFHAYNKNIYALDVYLVDITKSGVKRYESELIKKYTVDFLPKEALMYKVALLVIGGHAFPLIEIIRPKKDQIYTKQKMDTLRLETELSFSRVAIRTHSKTLKNEKITQSVYVSFDIETMNEDRLTGRLIPYAVGAEVIGDDSSKPTIFIGKDCFRKFIDWLGKKMIKYKNVLLFAHNGSKFDFYFLLLEIMMLREDETKLKHDWEIASPLFKASRIISCRLFARFNDLSGTCKFADTFLYFPMALRVLASIFGTKVQKSSFSYESIGNWNDVEERKNDIKNYLKKDVQALSGIIMEIKKYFIELYDLDPYTKLTAAGIAIGWFARFINKNKVIKNLQKISLTNHMAMKGAYFGGIVSPFVIGFFKTKYSNGILRGWIKDLKKRRKKLKNKIIKYKKLGIMPSGKITKSEQIKVELKTAKETIANHEETINMIPTIPPEGIEGISAYDANSLYPSVMWKNEFPTGEMKIELDNFTKLADIIKAGGMFIIDALVWVDPNTKMVPPFVKKTKLGNIMPTGTFRTFILSPTYAYALEMQEVYDFKFEIKKIFITYSWDETTPLFREAIEKLYNTKEEIDNEKVKLGKESKENNLKQKVYKNKEKTQTLSDTEIIELNKLQKRDNEIKKAITILNGKRTVIKLLLNSIYGAFGIGVETSSISFKRQTQNQTQVTNSWTESLIIKNRNEIEDFMILEWKSLILSDVRNLPIAAFTTDYARVEFLRLANEVRAQKDLILLYGDTDSIYALEIKKGAFKKLIEDSGRALGAKLGGWTYDLDGDIVTDLAVWAPKIKGYQTEKKSHITMKGVPMSSKFATRNMEVDELGRTFISYENQYSDQWFKENDKKSFQVSYSDLKKIAIAQVDYLKFKVRQIYVGKTVFLDADGKIVTKEITKKITFVMRKGKIEKNGHITPNILNIEAEKEKEKE